MGTNGTRSLGTILMGIGLLLILSVGGYFAWNEVQAAQVRIDLHESSAAAAVRVTRMAEELAQATPHAAVRSTAKPPNTAQPAASLAAAATVTRQASPAPSRTSVTPPSATTTATAPLSQLPTSTPTPTPAPSDTPAPTPTAAPESQLPVRLVIPDLRIDTGVEEMGWNVVQTKNGPVSEWAIPKNEAGHHLNSAGIGQQDNLVISGHNNIYGRVFMPISQVWTNDGALKIDAYTDESPVLDGHEIYLYDPAGRQYRYVITDFLRLRDSGVSQKQREANSKYMLPTGDERLTIITCWPPTNNTHRLIVIARPER